MSGNRFTVRGVLVERTDATADGPVVEVQRVGETDPRARWYVPTDELHPTAQPTPCPACHGRGYVTEDPLPECPGVDYEEHECRKCEGSMDATP